MPRPSSAFSALSLHRTLPLFAVSLIAWSSIATTAHAQVDFVVHGEAGMATMLSSHQREVLGFEHGIAASVRPGIRFADFFDLELAVGALWFPTTDDAPSDGLGRILLTGGGIRFEPRLGNVARLFFDGHASWAYTGDLHRFGIDAGLGLEFQAGNDVGIGPFVRYTHVLASGPNDGSDAMMLSYGLSLSIGTQRPPHTDTDADGWLDDDDECPTVAAGAWPDAAHPGCPMADFDGDGVHDERDVCPREPMGATPDPQREGCPLVDTDLDGVDDRTDVCPMEPAGLHPDPTRAGCPLPDTDGDAVFDPDDVCPTTPAGATPDPDRLGCPDGDDDVDGVVNSVDACRTEHSGFHPDVDHPGCPMADGDHDMIPDANDACPAEPGAPNENPRRNGCPGLVVLHIDSITIEQPVYFATGSDRILNRSRRLLTALAEAMRLTPEIRRLSIEGHTDSVGTEEDNLELSRRRAESVMAWLVEYGIEASRLEAHGFGESRPVAEGDSRAAREENRRVELRVIDPAPAGVEGGPR